MLVIFQNKIIYMPSMPPFSRREKIQEYAEQCRPVEWREERVRAADGVEVALGVGTVKKKEKDAMGRGRNGVVLYFQG